MSARGSLAALFAAVVVTATLPGAHAEIYGPPGSAGGGGGMATDAGNASLPNAATNLGRWTAQIHQNTQTGACSGTGA
jgi:hypothetical protein